MRNLNKLLAWGHARALENILTRSEVPRAIADQFGDERFIKNALMKKGKRISLEQRHRGEADPAVAAASVLARAEFLKRLSRLSDEIQIPLPKGASETVKRTAVKIARDRSVEVLRKTVKWHFKTTKEVLSESGSR